MLPCVLLPGVLAAQGNKFHRIVSGFCCQGGDVVRGRAQGFGRVSDTPTQTSTLAQAE